MNLKPSGRAQKSYRMFGLEGKIVPGMHDSWEFSAGRCREAGRFRLAQKSHRTSGQGGKSFSAYRTAGHLLLEAAGRLSVSNRKLQGDCPSLPGACPGAARSPKATRG